MLQQYLQLFNMQTKIQNWLLSDFVKLDDKPNSSDKRSSYLQQVRRFD